MQTVCTSFLPHVKNTVELSKVNTNGNAAATTRYYDYRCSHLHKGADYDLILSQDPWDEFMAERERGILTSILPKLFPSGIPRYLDFACGTGRITGLLETHVRESYGVDISREMMEQARRKCSRTTFLLGDVTKGEDLGVEPVDLVTAFRFFGNAQDELRRAAFHAIQRLLKPGGTLILNNHQNHWSLRNLLRVVKCRGQYASLSTLKLKRLLQEAGFRIDRTYGIGWWYPGSRLLDRVAVMDSRMVRLLDPLCRVRPLALFCPDLVIVARRVSG
jgi:SAM-dependent methyltransferase